jgi:hypothetical protein
MKIGINLVGVSYNDGKDGGRYRNYKDSIDSFFNYVVDPLEIQGHEVQFFIYTYDSIKKNHILHDYQPVTSSFIEPILNSAGGGDRLTTGMKLMSATYMNSLDQLVNYDRYHDLDVIISTRFDISFNVNPFEEFDYDFDKCNFLWREPEQTHIPIVSDTFIVLPRKMAHDLSMAILEMETNPPHNFKAGMHNIYLPMVNMVGEKNVQWVCDEFHRSDRNPYYKLTRSE